MNKHRITKAKDIPVTDRGAYAYSKLIVNDEATPFNAIKITVTGTHPTRRIVHGIRNYYVVEGSGTFVVEKDEYKVEEGTIVTIHPGECYSYNGTMKLFEFNIPTEGKVEHEDI